MWGWIAKAVDVAMAAENPGKIEEYQINHIVNAVVDCALPKSQEKSHAKLDSQDKANFIPAIEPDNKQGQLATWASIVGKREIA